MQKSSTSVRVGILHNPSISNSTKKPDQCLLSQATEAVLDSKEYTTSAMLGFLEKLLDKGNDFSKLLSDSEAIMNIVKDIKVRKSIDFQKRLTPVTFGEVSLENNLTRENISVIIDLLKVFPEHERILR